MQHYSYLKSEYSKTSLPIIYENEGIVAFKNLFHVSIQIAKTNTKYVHLSKYGEVHELESFERFERHAKNAALTPPWTEDRFPIPTQVTRNWIARTYLFSKEIYNAQRLENI